MNPALMVGYDTSDDACVYKITDEIAAIHTVDFFTPIVDDPYLFGQIAAANALSDVYAMGGRPAVAMNLLCVPNCLSLETIHKILLGGHDKAVEAGCAIAGGHTPECGRRARRCPGADQTHRNGSDHYGSQSRYGKPGGL